MRRKFYLHKRGGVFYVCLVNQETGLAMSARSTGERDRDAALIVVRLAPGRLAEQGRGTPEGFLPVPEGHAPDGQFQASGLNNLPSPDKGGAAVPAHPGGQLVAQGHHLAFQFRIGHGHFLFNLYVYNTNH
jgi:hypothetical protein